MTEDGSRWIDFWWSAVVAIFTLQLILPYTRQASIGNGRISLYTGQIINGNDTGLACLVDGFQYASETAIPRDHPCHYCICYQSQISCYWKQCVAPPINCEVMELENVCNPSLYICDIPPEVRLEPILPFGSRLISKRRKRITRATKSNEKSAEGNGESAGKLPVEEGFPVDFQVAFNTYIAKPSRHRRAIRADNGVLRDTSCTILGIQYNLGEIIGVASDICMECRCAAGRMFCSPKCCFIPAPLTISPMQWEGQSIFIKTQARGTSKNPHPLYYIKHQYE